MLFRSSDILEQAVARKIIDKSGAWYAYKGKKIGQGKENTVEFLNSNVSTLEELKAELLQNVNMTSHTVSEAAITPSEDISDDEAEIENSETPNSSIVNNNDIPVNVSSETEE